MKKTLTIGLGPQGQKYINYFIKNNYKSFGVCKTDETKQKIENKYKIEVSIDYKKYNLNDFKIIVIALPPEIQGKISLDILKSGFKNKLIIEIPITWDKQEFEELKKYNNAIFFLEEYYTLLAQFLRKIDLNKITNINVNILTNKADYEDLKAREVTYIHINNNFLGLEIDFSKVSYKFSFHEKEDIFYEIDFIYNGKSVRYVFNEEKYLQIGEKKYRDDYNFDKVLGNFLK